MPLIDVIFPIILRSKAKASVIQIGAFDGVTSDPLTKWISHPRVRSVLVEPQPEAFQLLQNRFRQSSDVSLVKAAVADQDGTLSLFVPNQSRASQVASLSEEHVSRLLGPTRSITVSGITVKSLLAQTRFDTVDLLQIDTEGMDYKILLQFFDCGIEPRVVNLESFHLVKSERIDLYESLATRNYAFIDHNLDTLAVKLDLIKDAF